MWMCYVIAGLFVIGGYITVRALQTTHFPGREDAY